MKWTTGQSELQSKYEDMQKRLLSNTWPQTQLNVTLTLMYNKNLDPVNVVPYVMICNMLIVFFNQALIKHKLN